MNKAFGHYQIRLIVFLYGQIQVSGYNKKCPVFNVPTLGQVMVRALAFPLLLIVDFDKINSIW